MIGYEFECGRCGSRFMAALDHRRDNLQRQSHTCGGLGRRLFHPALHRATFAAGWNDSVEQYFGTKRQRDNYFAENDLAIREPRI